MTICISTEPNKRGLYRWSVKDGDDRSAIYLADGEASTIDEAFAAAREAADAAEQKANDDYLARL